MTGADAQPQVSRRSGYAIRLSDRHLCDGAHQSDQCLEHVHDDDLPLRPNATDTRGRTFHEHMVHQCVSEDIWFRTMLDIDVGAPPLPTKEMRLEFMRRYEEDSGKRLAVLGRKMKRGGKAR